MSVANTAPLTDRAGEQHCVITGPGADVRDGFPFFDRERLDRLSRRFLALPLGAVEPDRGLMAHDVGDRPAGDRMPLLG